MTLSQKRMKTQSSPIILLESQLDIVDPIKYLGLTIQCDLTWSKYIQSICSKARRLVGLLFRQYYHYAEPSINTRDQDSTSLLSGQISSMPALFETPTSRIVKY